MMKRLQEPTRRAALGLIGGACALPRVALADSRAVETLTGSAFGTTWQVSAPSGQGLSRLRHSIDVLFAAIDAQFSPWRSDSVISRFNGAGTEIANADLCYVTSAAIDIARRSEGAFDPAVGPLVAQWGFGPIHGVPSDWRAIVIEDQRITKTRPDLTLDLCGIAKGWALDAAVNLIESNGISNLLFDLGGELISRGQHPSGRDWHVAVEASFPGAATPAILRLPDGTAVATSGTGVQSYTFDGVQYSHVIDPLTRKPIAGRLRSVSVIAPNAMEADGWATALLAAGDDLGPEIARAQNLAALFHYDDGGKARQLRVGAVADMIL